MPIAKALNAIRLDRAGARSWAALALALGCLPAAAIAPVERLLDNGMKVVVKEDHRSPVVASMVWYRAGSVDEPVGATGVAHVLEHMMFKGTHEVPPGQFSKIVAKAGGRDNAFTNRDYTAYFEQLQSSRLPLALHLEADRMARLNLSAEEFGKEIRVVMEERRMRTDDQARARLHEALMATAYRVHPYRTPVIGWMGDLEAMTVEDSRTWYERWYAPNNATLVVVGDVRAEEVFALAQQEFGGIPRRALPLRKAAAEPPGDGIRRVIVKAPAEVPYIIMAWRVPVLRDIDQDVDPYALWVLASVLDGTDASRFNRDLIRGTRVAVSAGAGYDPIGRGPGLFYVEAAPSSGTAPADLEAELRDHLVAIARDGVTEQELRRVKAQVVATAVFERDSMFYQAMQMGELDNAGLPVDAPDRMAHRIMQVSSEQIRAVARKYFQDDNLSVAVLEPQVLGAHAPAQVEQALEPSPPILAMPPL